VIASLPNVDVLGAFELCFFATIGSGLGIIVLIGLVTLIEDWRRRR